MNFSKPPPNFSQPLRQAGGPRNSVNLNSAKNCLSGPQGQPHKFRFPGPQQFIGGTRVFRPPKGGPPPPHGGPSLARAPTPRPVQVNPPHFLSARGPPQLQPQPVPVCHPRPNPSFQPGDPTKAGVPTLAYLPGGYGDQSRPASAPQLVQTVILPPAQGMQVPSCVLPHQQQHLVHQHPQPMELVMQSNQVLQQPAVMMGLHQVPSYSALGQPYTPYNNNARLPMAGLPLNGGAPIHPGGPLSVHPWGTLPVQPGGPISVNSGSSFPVHPGGPLHGCVLVQQPEAMHQPPHQPQSHWTTPPTSTTLPPTPLSANAPQCIPFPPPFTQPPPPFNPPLVSPPIPRPQISPRYETPPKTPVSSCTTSQPMFLSPPPPYNNSLVPVYPLTPAPPSTAPSPSQPPSDEIPDLRHQFLSNQFLPQPGQVVLLPPLPPDRSVQTIQLLVPGTSGQFQVQTIVLPIIKMEAGSQVTPEQTGWTVDQSTVVQQPKEESGGEPETEQEEGIMLNQVDATGLPAVMQGVDLEQVKRFACEFKSARLQLGLTQTQVGQALTGASEEQAVSQSTICRFEKLEITAQQVKKLLPQLKRWLAEAQERQAAGLPVVTMESVEGAAARENKKRKKRTVFNLETVGLLTEEFLVCPSPSSQAISDLAERVGLDKETVRVWFCNKRQQNKKIGGATLNHS